MNECIDSRSKLTVLALAFALSAYEVFTLKHLSQIHFVFAENDNGHRYEARRCSVATRY